MNNCKNCYHYHMCDLQYRLEKNQECKHFEDTSLIIELLIAIEKNSKMNEKFKLDSFGITTFRTYEEAEKKLKELEHHE